MLPTIIHGLTAITPTTHRIKRGRQHSMRQDHASGLLNYPASGLLAFVNGIVAQRCEAPLTKDYR